MGKTLDYSSVKNWMSLSAWVVGVYKNWPDYVSADVEEDPDLATDDGKRVFFNTIAKEALERGFSLRAGNRIDGFAHLLQVLDEDFGDDHLVKAYYRIDRESWLTPAGARGKRKHNHA